MENYSERKKLKYNKKNEKKDDVNENIESIFNVNSSYIFDKFKSFSSLPSHKENEFMSMLCHHSIKLYKKEFIRKDLIRSSGIRKNRVKRTVDYVSNDHKDMIKLMVKKTDKEIMQKIKMNKDNAELINEILEKNIKSSVNDMNIQSEKYISMIMKESIHKCTFNISKKSNNKSKPLKVSDAFEKSNIKSQEQYYSRVSDGSENKENVCNLHNIDCAMFWPLSVTDFRVDYRIYKGREHHLKSIKEIIQDLRRRCNQSWNERLPMHLCVYGKKNNDSESVMNRLCDNFESKGGCGHCAVFDLVNDKITERELNILFHKNIRKDDIIKIENDGINKDPEELIYGLNEINRIEYIKMLSANVIDNNRNNGVHSVPVLSKSGTVKLLDFAGIQGLSLTLYWVKLENMDFCPKQLELHIPHDCRLMGCAQVYSDMNFVCNLTGKTSNNDRASDKIVGMFSKSSLKDVYRIKQQIENDRLSKSIADNSLSHFWTKRSEDARNNRYFKQDMRHILKTKTKNGSRTTKEDMEDMEMIYSGRDDNGNRSIKRLSAAERRNRKKHVIKLLDEGSRRSLNMIKNGNWTNYEEYLNTCTMKMESILSVGDISRDARLRVLNKTEDEIKSKKVKMINETKNLLKLEMKKDKKKILKLKQKRRNDSKISSSSSSSSVIIHKINGKENHKITMYENNNLERQKIIKLIDEQKKNIVIRNIVIKGDKRNQINSDEGIIRYKRVMNDVSEYIDDDDRKKIESVFVKPSMIDDVNRIEIEILISVCLTFWIILRTRTTDGKNEPSLFPFENYIFAFLYLCRDGLILKDKEVGKGDNIVLFRPNDFLNFALPDLEYFKNGKINYSVKNNNNDNMSSSSKNGTQENENNNKTHNHVDRKFLMNTKNDLLEYKKVHNILKNMKKVMIKEIVDNRKDPKMFCPYENISKISPEEENEKCPSLFPSIRRRKRNRY